MLGSWSPVQNVLISSHVPPIHNSCVFSALSLQGAFHLHMQMHCTVECGPELLGGLLMPTTLLTGQLLK